jgi:hypothetical protein
VEELLVKPAVVSEGMDVIGQLTVVEMLVDVFDNFRGLVEDRKKGLQRWEYG